MRITFLAAAAALAASAFAAEPPPDTPLVTRADRADLTVTVADFKAAMAKVPAEQQDEYRASLERVQKTVSNIYLQRALARDAEAAGIDKEPEVQKRLQLLREGLLATVYMERFEKTIVAPDFEKRAREMYTASPERYKVPDKAKIQHILVAFAGRTRDEALRRVQEARAKLEAGVPFVRVAKEYTNDPSYRGNDGVIGPVSYASLTRELAEPARTLPLNRVSEPIESPAGYHLITVLERAPARVVPFEEVRQSLIADEVGRYKKQVVDKRLGEATASKDIVIHTDNVAALKTEFDRDEVRRLQEARAAEEAAAAAKSRGAAKPGAGR